MMCVRKLLSKPEERHGEDQAITRQLPSPSRELEDRSAEAVETNNLRRGKQCKVQADYIYRRRIVRGNSFFLNAW